MVEYLCFLPKYLDGIDLKQFNESLAKSINDAGQKRRWKLILEYPYKNRDDLLNVINQVTSLRNIVSLGVEVSEPNLGLLTQIAGHLPQNCFLIFNTSNLSRFSELIPNQMKLSRKLSREKIYIRNDSSFFDENVVQSFLASLDSNSNVIIDVPPERLLQKFENVNMYWDISQKSNVEVLGKIKKEKLFCSTSYSDQLVESNFINGSNQLDAWNPFRKKGLFQLIETMRNYGFEERDLVRCIHHNFLNFFCDQTI